MLGRARDKYQASAPPPAAQNPPLSKQLFPSSSPSNQDGNIAASFSKGRRPGFSGGPAAATSKAVANDPLRSTSNNIPHPFSKRPPAITSSYASGSSNNSLASLCAGSGSFDESRPGTAAARNKPAAAPPVYICDGDFSDDDNLELDYECPAAMSHNPPAVNKSACEKINTNSTTPSVPHAAPTGEIPWSSSPAEHFYPPTRTGRNPLKRPSPNHVSAPPGPPAAKKRSLPKSWKSEPLDDDEIEQVRADQEAALAQTPAPKANKNDLWNMSLSATKEQKKLLKNQNKKPESSDHSMAEIQAITQAHAKAKASAISLSSEQQQVLDLVLQKKQSVFFTGPAGTGKSVLMRAIIAEMKKKYARDPERLSVTASTGLAACNIGGQTLHSFSGIGLGKEDVPTLVKKIRRNAKAKNRWLRTSVLVVDEVSMVDGDLFDKLSQIARTIRNNGRPWGGIQLIITGDFFQLPPVPDHDKNRDIKFAFEAATWSTSIDHTIGLTQVFRQKDPEFANMLNEMRLGNIGPNTISAFRNLARPLACEDGLDVTELFPTRNEVERSNEFRLRNLPGEVRRYESADSGDPNVKDKLLQNMMAPKALDLKKGAQVMLIKNMDDTLVNGSLGRVVGFMNEGTFELWSERNDDEDGEEAGVKVDPRSNKIKAFSRELSPIKDAKEYPVVKFTATDGTHRILLCVPEEWKVELPTGEVQAQRKQLPLILAWALSIHKAQGQTLERVKVDLGKVFEKGQAYVALSRATSQQGLQVLRFEKSKVMAHPRVVTFYNKLYSVSEAAKSKKTASKPTPATITDFARKKPTPATGQRRGPREVVSLDDDEEAMAAYA